MQKLLSYTINAKKEEVIRFLSKPYHLKQWTIHRNLYLSEGNCYEASYDSDNIVFTKIEVLKERKYNTEKLRFQWIKEQNIIKFFDFEIKELNVLTTSIEVQMLNLPETSKQKRLERLLHIELDFLEKILNKQELSMRIEDAQFMESYKQK